MKSAWDCLHSRSSWPASASWSPSRSVKITPVVDASGRITNYLGLHRDITELQELECAVRNQRALISDLRMQEPAVVLLDAVRTEHGARSTEHGSSFGPFRPGAYAFLERQVRLNRPHWRSPRWYTCSGVWVAGASDSAEDFYATQPDAYLLLVATENTRQVVEQERAGWPR